MSLCLDRETIWRNKGWGEKRVWRNVQGSSSPGHLHRTVPKIPPCVWEQCPNTHWALTALGPWSLSWARRQTLVYSKFYFGAKHMKCQQGNQWGSAALETWWWQNPVINNCQGKKMTDELSHYQLSAWQFSPGDPTLHSRALSILTETRSAPCRTYSAWYQNEKWLQKPPFQHTTGSFVTFLLFIAVNEGPLLKVRPWGHRFPSVLFC